MSGRHTYEVMLVDVDTGAAQSITAFHKDGPVDLEGEDTIEIHDTMISKKELVVTPQQDEGATA